MTFEVLPSRRRSKVGDAAPASDTPTLADVDGDVSKISTDAKPDPAFYETSVADALAAHKPFVLVFATPKFCTSAQCGPTLDEIKPVAAAHPDVTFINVEPYQLEDVDGQLQPVLDAQGNLQVTDDDERVGPDLGAVDLRGRRDGIVRGVVRASSRRAAEMRPGRSRRSRSAARSRPPDGSPAAARRRAGTRRGPATRSPGARRGGPAGTRRRSRGRPSPNVGCWPSVVRSVKPRTSVSPAESTATTTPTMSTVPAGGSDALAGAPPGRTSPPRRPR